MRHLTQTLTLAALLAAWPGFAQTASDRPTKGSAEHSADTSKPGDEGVAPVAVTQGDNKADVTLTMSIRKAIEDDKRLSFHAKNVKVFTTNGQVTLRGRVIANQERTIIREHATAAAGENHVIDELEVRGSPSATN